MRISSRTPEVYLSRGVTHGEQLLVEAVARLRPSWEELSRPLIVLVPSGKLRQHVAARLVRRLDPSLLGVEVDSLRSRVHRILGNLGAEDGLELPLELWVDRELRRESELRRLPGRSAPAVAASVRDLLDAGLEPFHAEVLEEALDDEEILASREEIRRARGLLRLARRLRERADGIPWSLESRRLQCATDRLATAAAGDLPPCRAVVVYGFSDVTGVAGDFLERLLRRHGGAAILDLPPHPGEPATLEAAFAAPLLERFRSLARPITPSPEPAEARIEVFRADHAEAEVEGLATRIASDLCDGIPAEEIAVVFRDPSAYPFLLAHRFRSRALPFSSSAIAGARSPEMRRWRALVDLVVAGEGAELELWSAALAPDFLHERREEMALAFRSLGLTKLADWAALEPPPKGLRLPIREGLTARDPAQRPSSRRRLDAGLLDRWRQAAKRCLESLAAWPDSATFEEHAARFAALAASLGWTAPPKELSAALEKRLPPDFELTRAELATLASSLLDSLGHLPLGGQGGGIQVLTVMEARHHRFRRLYLAGMHRGSFPKPVNEDPLFPDALRRQLLDVLPDLPLKTRGYDEDRYLFAQLLTAADRVTLSFSLHDDASSRLPSSFVDSLRRRRPDLELQDFPAADFGGSTRHPPEDWLLAAARKGRRPLAELLPEAWAVLSREVAESRPEVEARARIDLWEHLEERFGDRGEGTAFLGALAPPSSPLDPRRGSLAVTTAESLVRCPWRTLLTRFLRLEATPDPHGILPALDARRVGILVHGVLETLVERIVTEEGEAATVPWPDEASLRSLVRETAERQLLDEGCRLPGLADALARTALPFLETARRLDWPGGESRYPIQGAESRGRVQPDPEIGDLPLEFRADRLDRLPEGWLRTDYKTGRPFSTAKNAATRRRALHREILRGRSLQIAAYALGEGDEPAHGRLLFLRPDLEDEQRSYEVGVEDEDLVAAYRDSVESLARSLETGMFFPRLTDPQGQREPPPCKSCEVADACVRGDSGARARLLELVDAVRGGDLDSAAMRSFLRVWNLPDRKELPS